MSGKRRDEYAQQHVDVHAAGAGFGHSPLIERMQARSSRSECNDLRQRVSDRLLSSFDPSRALAVIAKETDGDFCVFGGSLRRVLLGNAGMGDLDIMVPNGDHRAIKALDMLGVPYQHNSQGHRRFRWNNLQIDIFCPIEFYSGFGTVGEALTFFDLKINALALHWRTCELIDPFGVSSQIDPVDPGINWSRWGRMQGQELAILAIRLARIMFEAPRLRLNSQDAGRMREEVLPKVTEVDWSDIQYRYPPGREAFVRDFSAIVLKEKV